MDSARTLGEAVPAIAAKHAVEKPQGPRMRLVALLLTAYLFTPAAALADALEDHAATGPVIAASLDAAQEFWHDRLPVVTVYTADFSNSEWAGTASAPDQPHDSIWLSTRIMPNAVPRSKTYACAVIVHEYGHLLGRGHSSDGRSVMFDRLEYHNIPWPCFRRLIVPGSRDYWTLLDEISGPLVWSRR